MKEKLYQHLKRAAIKTYHDGSGSLDSSWPLRCAIEEDNCARLLWQDSIFWPRPPPAHALLAVHALPLSLVLNVASSLSRLFPIPTARSSLPSSRLLPRLPFCTTSRSVIVPVCLSTCYALGISHLPPCPAHSPIFLSLSGYVSLNHPSHPLV